MFDCVTLMNCDLLCAVPLRSGFWLSWVCFVVYLTRTPKNTGACRHVGAVTVRHRLYLGGSDTSTSVVRLKEQEYSMRAVS